VESERCIRFIEQLNNPEGTEWAGQPIKLLEWQKSYLRKLLDTKDSKGNIQYEQSLIFLPKKQGKTTFIAALALYFLVKRKHGQIKALAQVKEQAGILYHFVASMIRQDPYLSQRKICRVYKGNQKRIECFPSDSALQVLSSDATGAQGLNASVLLFDEICFSQSSELWDAVISGGISRKSLLAIGLSTAGWDMAGFGFQFYERAKAILANPELDPTFLPVIYEAPVDADWTKPETYLACSPTFQEIGSDAIRRIESMIATAMKDPSQLRRIRRYHLNQWIGSEAVKLWVGLEKFDACRAEYPDLSGRSCWGGLDLGAVKDLTALALLFPPDEGSTVGIDSGRYYSLLKFYMPADTLAQREREDGGAQYTAWHRAGLIVATPGWCTDYNYIRADLKVMRDKYNLLGLGVDRMFNATDVIKQLAEDGVNVVPMGQGPFTIIPAARELENMIERRTFAHDGNPVLRWMFANCVGVIDECGNVKPSKKKSTGRIDGVFSLLDAVAVEMANRQAANAEPAIFV
jgi:phage terminase large subunit-like protein